MNTTKTSTREKVTTTMACTAFAEAVVTCPLCAEKEAHNPAEESLRQNIVVAFYDSDKNVRLTGP
ncbi:MAG: hypothetical protein ACOY32_11985 [Thermodesulfobacteriota bacterium]